MIDEKDILIESEIFVRKTQDVDSEEQTLANGKFKKMTLALTPSCLAQIQRYNNIDQIKNVKKCLNIEFCRLIETRLKIK